MFRINEVLSLDNQLYRILADLSEELVWISIEDKAALPSVVSKTNLVNAIEREILTRAEDPFQILSFRVLEDDSSAKVIRDKNYELIKPIVLEPRFYVPKVRSSIINRVILEQGTTKKTLYFLLRRYWQRGQTPNALIRDYKNSGGKGKVRVAKNKKLGRPRLHSPGIGVTVNAGVEKLFRIAIDRYLLTEKKHSFSYAHRRFQSLYANYYPDSEESAIPTKWQMLHFFKREYSQIEKIQKRSNKIEYKKDVQPLNGTANIQTLGPGSRFEIDATIADIYLVSDSDRKNIVGRPIVYIVIDVFSRMIAGLYIGFENPSYAAAMQALAMALTDKVAYCKQYDFDIEAPDWPATGLPDAVLADRGELLGHQIESLERSFSVRIENTPPYRGDAKGVVERYFRTVQADFKPFAPGVVTENKVKKRGGRDYRLDAVLTVREFNEIILESVLFHNRFHVLKKYDRSIDMPADLEMTPLSLWNWGVQHRTGRLRTASEDALRVSLFPRVKGTLSELGLCVFGLYYTSQEILKQGWLHRGKGISKPEAFEVAYDPAVADVVYLLPTKNSIEYWLCSLTDRSREFRECSFWDVWQIQAIQKSTIAKSKLVADVKKRELEDRIAEKIKNAQIQAPETDTLSKSERITAIRKNRQQAKDQERQTAKDLQQQSSKEKKSANIIPLTQQPDDYSYPDFIDELFGDD
ncbi:MAG: DDE-type integrase/transposase/recombinase [Methylobacter sp.]|uniref:DDE-type integrase/transposase/recombinase n=1 Tax=Methylobacter sp. TaxID=2051955 RepID=UPI00272FD263|nr:DDE-type integrase/transposase/recombinase [Methylobacter sp.]MDP1664235.1 DDE-type integrase/transposase/recombinase [Methylobacter sp.]